MPVTAQTRTTPTRRRPTQSTVTPTSTAAPQRSVEPKTVIQTNPRTSANLVFQVLLGAAAMLALVAVVQQAGTSQIDPTSVNAPPPAVFVQSD